ncbi:MAG: hypothetical protein HQK53_18545, partial [Oligoflexia bacterium]|nr:hypothetical protein [Oligoflexia bacterium]
MYTLKNNNTLPSWNSNDLEQKSLKLTITKDDIDSIDRDSPLYRFANKVKSCIQSVDVTISKSQIASNNIAGDNVRLLIKVTPNISALNYNCRTIRKIDSEVLYDFIP